MDLAVTVGAAPVKEKRLASSSSTRRARMEVVYMTRGADSRVRKLQEPVVVRAVGIVAVAAVFHDRNMFPKEGPAPLRVAGITVLVGARLFEHDGIGGAVRIVAVATGDLSLPHRHVRGALEHGFSLEVALAANLGLGPLVKKGRLVIDFGKLEAVGGLLHDRMTADATDSTSGMRACLPIGLHSSLVAGQAGLVLSRSRLFSALAECNWDADTLPAPLRHVLTCRTVARFAVLLFKIIAGIGRKDLPHHRLGKLFGLG